MIGIHKRRKNQGERQKNSSEKLFTGSMRHFRSESIAALALFVFITVSRNYLKVIGRSFSGPVKRSSRTVREVYPEIEPEKEGNLADGMYTY